MWTKQGKYLEKSLELAKYYNETFVGTDGARLLATVYLKMDQEEKALNIYGTEFIKNYLSNNYEMESYANFWVSNAKNLENALEISRKLVDNRSTASWYWDLLARAFWKLEKYQEAINAEEKAIELTKGLNVFEDEFKKRLEEIKIDKEKKKK